MALTTGGRKSELLGLNGLSINFTSRRASLKTTKNGKPRLLPLTQPVIEELIRIRDSSTIVDKNVVSLMPVNNDELIFHGMKHKNKPFEMRKPFARA